MMKCANRRWALAWVGVIFFLGAWQAARAAPVVTSVHGPSPGTHNINDRYGTYVVVDFSESINVTGNQLSITVRLGPTTAVFTGPVVTGGNRELVFAMPPSSGQGALTITGPINLNGGTIKNNSGIDADLSFSPVSLPSVIIDESPPAPPVINRINPALPNSTQTFTISGTSEPLGSVVFSMDNGYSYRETPVDANGNWSAAFGPMAAGAHVLGADAKDQAGNSAGAPTGMTAHFQFTVQSAGPSATPAHLVNLSARAYANKGADGLIAGFVVGGDAAGAKPVLMRGIGPTLAQFGVPNPVRWAALTLDSSGGHVVSTNDGWGVDPLLSSTSARVGAFALPNNSGDSAIVWWLYPGAYTVQVTDDTGLGGNALAEVYDAAAADLSTKLVNISVRASLGSGLVGGFVIAGDGSETVLIRGIGPALGQFGVPSPATAPTLTLFNQAGQMIAQNAGWPTNTTLNGSIVSVADVFTAVGAFPLTAGSTDCAILVSLPAGNYTAQLSHSAASSGNIGLIEIYEVAGK